MGDAVARLSDDLTQERETRREERFYWILATVTLFDCAMFPYVPWWLGLVLLVGQVAILPGIAARLGVDWAVTALDKLWGWIESKKNLGP